MTLLPSLLAGFLAAAAPAAPAYTATAAVPLGAPDRWDYVVYDTTSRRVFVAHGDRVTVVDPTAARIVGEVRGVPGGTHGIAISAATGQGFTDDGTAGTAIPFDLGTLEIRTAIPTRDDADGMAFDAATGHVFVVDGDPGAVSVVDPAADRPLATIEAGEKLEYPVSDDHGSLYVAGEEKGDLVRIDTRRNAIVAHYPAPGCSSPHGLAIDKARRRLFMGCANAVMTVFDADDGHVVATLPIGRGNDAVAFDPVRRRVVSSNGLDGTITVFEEATPDRYVPLAPVRTLASGRTMALDPVSGRLFVAAADTDPATTPGARLKPRPGTLRLLMFDPATASITPDGRSRRQASRRRRAGS